MKLMEEPRNPDYRRYEWISDESGGSYNNFLFREILIASLERETTYRENGTVIALSTARDPLKQKSR
jgi:hypothetical protein